MQRVRIGLTGLACVFLLVLLAAAFFGLTNDERETGPLVVAPTDTALANAVDGDAPREPLAELGVAPGHTPEAEVAANVLAPAPPPSAPVVLRQAPPAPATSRPPAN